MDDHLRTTYQRKDVVGKYFESRFGTPLGKVQHEQQVLFVQSHLNACKSERVLEIAIGPGRITAEIQTPNMCAIGLDTSRIMLAAAKDRFHLYGNAAWNLVLGDGFSLPFKSGYFDSAFSFRFVRHLRRAERSMVYSEIKRVLKGGGAFMFDAPNAHHADLVGPVYDQSWSKSALVSEIAEEGFVPESITPNLCWYVFENCVSAFRHVGFSSRVERWIKTMESSNVMRKVIRPSPLEWLVLCRKS